MLLMYNIDKQNKLCCIKETRNTKEVQKCCEQNVILPVSNHNQERKTSLLILYAIYKNLSEHITIRAQNNTLLYRISML